VRKSARQGLKSLADRESPRFVDSKDFFSPLEWTFAISPAIYCPAGFMGSDKAVISNPVASE
jgi:hypothetical protein